MSSSSSSLSSFSQKVFLHDYFDPSKISFESNHPLIIHHDIHRTEILTNAQVDTLSEIVKRELEELIILEKSVNKHCFIGLDYDDELFYPSILGVLRTGCGFFPLQNNAAHSKEIRKLPIKLILSRKKNFYPEFQKIKEFELIYNDRREIINVFDNNNSKHVHGLHEFAYGITTSGSTGDPKVILVPHNAITINIHDFIHRAFELRKSDVIFAYSPTTFDVSIVDFFCACGVGGTLLTTTAQIKSTPTRLSRLISNATIVQITPSGFNSIVTELEKLTKLNLRMLAFGGEKFPNRNLLKRIQFNPEMKILNLYGLTEMSCWAAWGVVNFVEDNWNFPVFNEFVGGTTVKLVKSQEDDIAEIVLCSETRYCFEVTPKGLRKLSVLNTNDMAIETPAGFYISHRKDNIIKRNGFKIPLNCIEKAVLQNPQIQEAHCKYVDEKIYLIVKGDLGLVDLTSLPLVYYPDVIVKTKVMELNQNGKLDFEKIIKKCKISSQIDRIKIDFVQLHELIEPIWNRATGIDNRNECFNKLNFFESGGTSASARWMIETIFDFLNLYGSKTQQENSASLFLKLFELDFQRYVEYFHEIVNHIGIEVNDSSALDVETDCKTCWETEPFQDIVYWKGLKLNIDSGKLITWNQENNYTINMSKKMKTISARLTTYNLRMCVDASPLFVGDLLICSSHSGLIVAVDTKRMGTKNTVLWAQKLDGRIEAEVVWNYKLHLFVGTTGNKKAIYKLSLKTGQIEASHCTNGNVRSRIAVFDDKLVYVDDIENICCLDQKLLRLIWRQTSHKPCPTINPTIFRNYVIICIFGDCHVALDLKSGLVTWENKDSYLVSVFGDNEMLVCSNTQGFQVLNDTFQIIIAIPMDEKIQGLLHDSCEANVIILTPSKIIILDNLYKVCKKITFSSDKIQLPTLISTVSSGYLLFFKRANSFFILDLQSESEREFYNLGSNIETFSKPVYNDNFIAFGARDDLLRVFGE